MKGIARTIGPWGRAAERGAAPGTNVLLPHRPALPYRARHGRIHDMIELLTDPQAWIAFLTLTALELVLGIDNIVFISILVDRLPPERRVLARRIGLFLAMFMRIGLLFLLAWLAGLTAPLLTVLAQELSGRDLILIGGGLFLIWKSTKEIHELMEGGTETATSVAAA